MSDDRSSISDDVISAYLDGEADAAQLKAVQRALETDPGFAVRLERRRASDLSVRTAFQDLAERPVPAALEAAIRVAAQGASAPAMSQPEAKPRRAGWLQGLRTPTWIGAALAAQAALLVAGVVLLPPRVATSNPPAAYHALSARTPAPVANVIIMFRPDAREQDLRSAVKSVGGELVGGPNGADAYMLRVPAAQREAAITALRGRPEVSMAEPIDAAVRP